MDTWAFDALVGLVLAYLAGAASNYAATAAWVHRTNAERARQLCSVLREAFILNHELLCHIRQIAETSNALTFINLDLCMLDGTAVTKYELLSLELCAKIDRSRFLMSRLFFLVEMLQRLHADPTARQAVWRTDADGSNAEQTTFMAERSPQIKRAMSLQCAEVIPLVENLIAELKQSGHGSHERQQELLT